jgi:prepilin-type N-terminal cleavage/methylation domain-containing protein
MKVIKNSRRAFTLIEIMIVVTIIGLLAVIAVCNYVMARDTSRLTVIRSNLRDIETAKEQWAIENRKGLGAPVVDVDVIKDYLRRGGLKVVISETYNPNPIGTPPSAALPADVKLGPYGLGATIPAP